MRMRIPGMREAPAKRGVDTLRSIIALSKTGEVLHEIPERLANVISRFDSVPLSPDFRHDIYSILATSLDLAEALIDATYPIEHASSQIAAQMQTLSRVLQHLNHRPSRQGYSILVPSTQVLIGQFSTAQEADVYMQNLRALGAMGEAMVVPVKMTSLHAIQPRMVMPAPQPAPDPMMTDPLPKGIVPNQPNLQDSVGLSPTESSFDELARIQEAKQPVAVKIPTIPSIKERMANLEKEAAELGKPRPGPSRTE